MRVYLGDIAEIQVGYQSREGIRAHTDGSHFLLQARDFNKLHQIDWPNLTRFTPSGSTNKSEIKQGDVLFLARGQENFSYLINHDSHNILASNSFYLLRVKPQFLLPKFLVWWINQTPAQDFFKLNRRVGMVPLIPVSDLSRLEVPVPSIEIQNKIGELELLRKKEAGLLDLYLSKKTTLIQTVCLKAIIE